VTTLSRESRQPPGSPARPALPPKPPAPSRSAWRWPLIGALIAVAAVVIYFATRQTSYHYRLDFTNAGQLVTGDLVRIGGTPAGTVDSITLTPNGLAQIGISLNPSFGPLRTGTTATIRSPGLTAVASRYIDVSPAPSFRPALRDNGLIPATDTTGIVDIDELFDALDANTREGLRRLIRGFGAWYQGKSAQANLTARYFPPALRAYSNLFTEIDASTPALNEFLTQTSRALGAIDERAPQLTDAITQARITAQAISSENRALSEALVNLPGALKRGSYTFYRLRTRTLPALTRLFNATAPVTGPLAQFLPRLDPVLQEAVPTFSLLSELFYRPGPNNDLYDALVALPALAKEVGADFPRAIEALHKSTPVFEFARPYIPDLVAWLVNWDGLFATYDANGHYGRTVPMLDAFHFTDTPAGGTLTQVFPSQRGSGPPLKTGFLHRCPGGAIVPPPDHSAPYYDTGPLSNAHCRPSETIGGSP
jgi:phospholipid/cholesterol/gamma-HCH transport system substrate-binding protein